MAFVESDQGAAIRYPRRSMQRAERAFRCSPLRLELLEDLRSRSVSIRQVAEPAGLKNRYSRRALSELQAENEMMWLIAVGLLRREVDGQGLTDSFRLTPLGRQVWHSLSQLRPAQLRPSLGDHLYNAWCRWLRLPGWWQG
ncbi:MAG: Npun_F0494 family protein [Nodosilinea sp.]